VERTFDSHIVSPLDVIEEQRSILRRKEDFLTEHKLDLFANSHRIENRLKAKIQANINKKLGLI
jgi:UTP:GlnB (protein PII) uridylyltransferase